MKIERNAVLDFTAWVRERNSRRKIKTEHIYAKAGEALYEYMERHS